MAKILQYSVALRNARGDVVQTTIGASGSVLKLFGGTIPANCAAPDAGTALASINLPNPWKAAFSGGVGQKAGAWQTLSVDNAGTLTHYRIYDSLGACHEQGNAGLADTTMIADRVDLVSGQSVTVTTYEVTEGNA